MSRRTTWFYGLLLLLPTLIVGGVLASLLADERERLARAGVLAAEGQVRALASEILVAVNGLKAEILRQLVSLSATDPAPALQAWETRDPLIRNVFVVTDGQGVRLPDATRGLTGEEHAFLQRFEPLLSGPTAWDQPPADGDAAPARPLLTQTLRGRCGDPRVSVRGRCRVS